MPCLVKLLIVLLRFWIVRTRSVSVGITEKNAVSVSVLRTVTEQLKLSYKFYNNRAYLLPLPAVQIRGLTQTQILGSAHLWWLFVTAVGDWVSNWRSLFVVHSLRWSHAAAFNCQLRNLAVAGCCGPSGGRLCIVQWVNFNTAAAQSD